MVFKGPVDIEAPQREMQHMLFGRKGLRCRIDVTSKNLAIEAVDNYLQDKE